MATLNDKTRPIPSSILIVGSGVFGLSTAYELAKDVKYNNTKITLVDRSVFPSADGSSIDTSRIIRADYADPAYSALMALAHTHWHGPLGASGRYHEAGLVLTGDPGQNEDYVLGSLANVLALEAAALKANPSVPSRGLKAVEVLRSRDEIKSAMNGTGAAGSMGYLNRRSGWADAEACMRWLREQVEGTGRVEFVKATVVRLLFDRSSTPPRVTGVRLSDHDPDTLTADLTILAAGAWTPSLLDLRGIATATGQIIAYIPLTEPEQATLGKNPTILHLSSGMFVITPHNRLLKIARHGYGYANPTLIPHPESPIPSSLSPEEGTIIVSLPSPDTTTLPPEAHTAFRHTLTQLLPALATRPFARTRICWYTDTPTGDFLLSHHPLYAGLFVATGGSGHAFKFLPVIGDMVVQALEGRLEEGLARKWGWPGERLKEGGWGGDGSRAGGRGMVLAVEMRKKENGKL